MYIISKNILQTYETNAILGGGYHAAGKFNRNGELLGKSPFRTLKFMRCEARNKTFFLMCWYRKMINV